MKYLKKQRIYGGLGYGVRRNKENAFIRQACVLVEREYGTRKMYIADIDDNGIATLREEPLQ